MQSQRYSQTTTTSRSILNGCSFNMIFKKGGNKYRKSLQQSKTHNQRTTTGEKKGEKPTKSYDRLK